MIKRLRLQRPNRACVFFHTSLLIPCRSNRYAQPPQPARTKKAEWTDLPAGKIRPFRSLSPPSRSAVRTIPHPGGKIPQTPYFALLRSLIGLNSSFGSNIVPACFP